MELNLLAGPNDLKTDLDSFEQFNIGGEGEGFVCVCVWVELGQQIERKSQNEMIFVC